MTKKEDVVIPPKADIKISGNKALVFTIVLFILNAIIEFISAANFSWLDITIRAGISGIVLGVINYIKHKYQ